MLMPLQSVETSVKCFFLHVTPKNAHIRYLIANVPVIVISFRRSVYQANVLALPIARCVLDCERLALMTF